MTFKTYNLNNTKLNIKISIIHINIFLNEIYMNTTQHFKCKAFT